MSQPVPNNPNPVRLRRTGAPRTSSAPVASVRRTPPFRPFSPFARRRNPNAAKYWAILLILAAVLFAAQSFWMRRARARQEFNFDSSIVFKLTNFLQDRAGAATTSDPTHTPATLPAPAGVPDAASPALPRGSELVACDVCGGLGLTLAPATGAEIPCPLCQGHGSRLIRRLTPSDELCPACGGMGATLAADGVTAESCPRCGGRGLISPAEAPR